MKWFYDLRIATKLITSFLLVLVLTAMTGVFAIIQLGLVNETAAEMRDNWLPSVRVVSGIRFFCRQLSGQGTALSDGRQPDGTGAI